MRLLSLSLLAGALLAQTPKVPDKLLHLPLIPPLDQPARPAAPARLAEVTAPQRPCAIPLTRVTPRGAGSGMPVVRPPASLAKMPEVTPPAPSCDDPQRP
jgi:hypothetical protein